jgi:hypothetical protein
MVELVKHTISDKLQTLIGLGQSDDERTSLCSRNANINRKNFENKRY